MFFLPEYRLLPANGNTVKSRIRGCCLLPGVLFRGFQKKAKKLRSLQLASKLFAIYEPQSFPCAAFGAFVGTQGVPVCRGKAYPQ